jgi:hypothetical protein
MPGYKNNSLQIKPASRRAKQNRLFIYTTQAKMTTAREVVWGWMLEQCVLKKEREEENKTTVLSVLVFCGRLTPN